MEKVIIGDATLYHGDCMDVLPTLGKIDAVVTDPPYGINTRTRVNFPTPQEWDKDRINPSVLLTIAPQILIWGGQYIADLLPPSESWAVWVKRPINCDFSKDNRTYATTELAWSNFGKARFISHVWDGGMRAGKRENRDFCHPSQKPVEVMEWCLPQHAEFVCDHFMGSGTTGVACMNLGRKFIGIELERKYFDIACERIEAAQRQGRLFVPDRPGDSYDQVGIDYGG